MGTSGVTERHHGTTVPAALAPLLIAAAITVPLFRWAGAFTLIGAGAARWFWYQRLHLELRDEDAIVTRPQRQVAVPWSSVTAVKAGSFWRGGLVLETTSGAVHSDVPTSRWGGRATPAQVAAIERWWQDHRPAEGRPT